MKPEAIKVGAVYGDKKLGMRRALETGTHLKTSGNDEDAMGVRYEILMAIKEPDIGTESTMELKSFAIWAKIEVPPHDVDTHLIAIKAHKLAPKLSKTQREFMLTFDNELTETDFVECGRKEFRVASSCRDKGLIIEMPEKLTAGERYFDIRLSALGLAVLANAREETNQEVV